MDRLLQPYELNSERLAEATRKHIGEGDIPSPKRLRVSDGVKTTLRQGAKLTNGSITLAKLLLAMLSTDEELETLLEDLGVRTQTLIETLREDQEEPAEAEEPARRPPTPTLDRFGRDLTKLAREGALPLVIGRDQETLSMMEVLCRQTKRNPILVGPPGVGKTALVEGLAQQIVAGTVPHPLQERRLVELSISSLVAGAGRVGQFEERLQALTNEVTRAGNVILFIDEIHALLGAGGMYGLQDAATILKPALARGVITCIGATTTHDYRKYIEKDGALARRFQPVRVEEPTQEITLGILQALRPRLENHFGISLPEERLQTIHDLAHRYLKNRYFPDKAVDLLERSASRAMLIGSATLERDHILSVLSDITGIPLTEFEADEAARYLEMEEELRKRVVGQDDAVDAVASLIRLTKRRLDIDPSRPDGVFLFVGPPGVGKTELAKALTEFLFGDESRLIRLDMSEFSESFTISRLIGSPPGYVGYDQEGQLTGRVMNHPFCVILLDEIDKAHPSVLNLFLQVFDDGRLTDAQGRTVTFSDATVIMTTNVSADIWSTAPIGFEAVDDRGLEVGTDGATRALHRRLPDEFLSRVDEIVLFRPLDRPSVAHIVSNKLQTLVGARFARQGIEVHFDKEVVQYIVNIGFDPRMGARQLERVIQREILEPLAEQTYHPDWQGNSQITVLITDEDVSFRQGE